MELLLLELLEPSKSCMVMHKHRMHLHRRTSCRGKRIAWREVRNASSFRIRYRTMLDHKLFQRHSLVHNQRIQRHS